jgi:hypothetical protein
VLRLGARLRRGSWPLSKTFGDRINLHPHLHFLVTEGGVDEAAALPVLMNMSAGVFHQIRRLDDSRLTEVFAREVLAMLVCKELLSPEWTERILSWRHTGFNVHGGRGPRLCLGIIFRRTRPWIRTRASGEPKARPW